jgi:putative nucleotidyltransferase with HDIG domain
LPATTAANRIALLVEDFAPRKEDSPPRDPAAMADQIDSTLSDAAPDEAYSPVPLGLPKETARPVAEISSLLSSLDEVAAESGQSVGQARAVAHESKLVHARLGIASGLHAALRAKHPPTASHCLRVALGCSSWAAAMELDEDVRDALEVAALLHDVGKIGVSDKVLLKPGRLLPEEVTLMSRHAALTMDILTSCGVPQSVLEIVHYSRAWYGNRDGQQDRQGDDLPLAARMLAIVMPDSMTTDHVYRSARSRGGRSRNCMNSPAASSIRICRQFEVLFEQDQNLLTEAVVAGCIGARGWCVLP